MKMNPLLQSLIGSVMQIIIERGLIIFLIKSTFSVRYAVLVHLKPCISKRTLIYCIYRYFKTLIITHKFEVMLFLLCLSKTNLRLIKICKFDFSVRSGNFVSCCRHLSETPCSNVCIVMLIYLYKGLVITSG